MESRSRERSCTTRLAIASRADRLKKNREVRYTLRCC